MSVGGNFTFTQTSSGTSTITAFRVDTIFYAGSSLNNTANNGLMTDYDLGYLPSNGALSVTNQVLPKTFARRASATFNFDSTLNAITQPIVVLNLSSTTDLSFYQGTGISFAPAFTSITQIMLTGTFTGNPVRDYSQLTESVGMSLTYDYIPPMIPEPSYYGFTIGIAAFSFCLRRRYQTRSVGPKIRLTGGSIQ